MRAYFETVEKRKDELVVLFYVVTENPTLRKSYAIYTNYHCDWGICNDMYNHLYTSKKKAFDKEVQEFQKIFKKKMKLHKIDNDENFTRFVYKLEM